MKFCKNMQRMAELADPEWAAFWVNYKMLKKIIKALPTVINSTQENVTRDKDDENKAPGSPRGMDKSPGEFTFFKLLHSEVVKATQFFSKAGQEFSIREERITEGMAILQQPSSMLVHDRWSLLARSIFRFYKELLLLETYAIMTYCAFSKILKKHDKNTGYNTRVAFMAKVVNNTNFSSYPSLLEMISRSEKLYGTVAEKLAEEGNSALYEDERLFISMIHRLNQQALGTATAEGRQGPMLKRDIIGNTSASEDDYTKALGFIQNVRSTNAHSILKNLIEENDAAAVGVSSGDESDHDKKHSVKRKVFTSQNSEDDECGESSTVKNVSIKQRKLS